MDSGAMDSGAMDSGAIDLGAMEGAIDAAVVGVAPPDVVLAAGELLLPAPQAVIRKTPAKASAPIRDMRI